MTAQKELPKPIAVPALDQLKLRVVFSNGERADLI